MGTKRGMRVSPVKDLKSRSAESAEKTRRRACLQSPPASDTPKPKKEIENSQSQRHSGSPVPPPRPLRPSLRLRDSAVPILPSRARRPCHEWRDHRQCSQITDRSTLLTVGLPVSA